MRGKFTLTLRVRMTVLFGLVVLIGCLALAYISQNNANSALEAEAQDAMLKVAQQVAATQDSRNQARIYAVEALANRNVVRGIQGDREAKPEEKMQALQDEQKRAESLGFKQFGIVDQQGNAVLSDGSKINISDRDYFKEALGGKTAVSSTLVSKADSSIVFVIATPIRHYNTNEITGVLIGIIDAEKFSNLVGSITVARTGYAFAVDSAGKTIAHKDVERVKSQENIVEQARANPALAPLAAIVAKMAKGEEGVATYTFQGQDKIIAYAPVKSTGWSIAVTAPTVEVLARAANMKWAMLVTSIIIILLALLVTYVLARSITIPIVQIMNHLRLIAGGDFTAPVPEVFLLKKDVIGKLAHAVDLLQANIKPLLGGLKTDAQTLAGNSEALSASAEEIAASSGETAKAIQQVAAGAGEQSNHLQEILGLIENITSNLQEVFNELGQVKANSEETTRLADLGKQELDGLIASIKSVRDAFQVVADKLGGLKGSVNQAGEILEVINGIAEQTNLLALNAAIEAARAGDAGRGFAVVAEEVRKLAEQSRASSDKIRELLNNIASETNAVVSTSAEVGKQVEGQRASVENTVKSFNDILDAVAAIGPMIEETYRQVDGTVKAKDVVLERVQSVSAVSEEASASAEEIAASAEELSASTQEIAANAQQVLEVAKRLEEQVAQFKV